MNDEVRKRYRPWVPPSEGERPAPSADWVRKGPRRPLYEVGGGSEDNPGDEHGSAASGREDRDEPDEGSDAVERDEEHAESGQRLLTREEFLARISYVRRLIRKQGRMRRLYRLGLLRMVFDHKAAMERRKAYFAAGGMITLCPPGRAMGAYWAAGFKTKAQIADDENMRQGLIEQRVTQSPLALDEEPGLWSEPT